MQSLASWPERQARLLRWLLLVGWLLLILSLLVPSLQLPDALTPDCPAQLPRCELHQQPGNRLFWGTVVPLSILLIAGVSHELWRRICPLAFVSQLFRALGIQRTRPGRGGRQEVVKVTAESWLGRHHIQLQWSLLIAGLCLRLLVVNSSALGLALLLISTLLAALAVGWAYGGKAWCQYVCPMGPVQAVLTGPRGPLGSTAHLGARSRISQSMCRTLGEQGGEQSACVACQTPCLDIDAERAYWQTTNGKRGFSWAWYSYPGLVLAFFFLLKLSQPPELALVPELSYLRTGLWAFDAALPSRALDPFLPQLPLPRLVAIPLLLVAAGALSAQLFGWIETRLRPAGEPHHAQVQQLLQQQAISRTRLLATFCAVNTFFWFVDPSQGALGSSGAQLLRSLVLSISAIWLFRGWSRDPAVYRRESTSESLRKQLANLPGLQEALDGRTPEQLSPEEVFTLVKAMPAIGQQQSLEVYEHVMADMLRSGRLDSAQSLLELQELRQTLDLQPQDHHEVLRRLAQDQPELLERDWRELQSEELRREAAIEGLQDLMATAGLEVLIPDGLAAPLQRKLEQLRCGSGLSEIVWQELLASYGPSGSHQQQRLQRQREVWLEQAGWRKLLDQQALADPLYQPLARAMEERVTAMAALLGPRLQEAGLAPLPAHADAAGSLQEALDLLWQDPDPDTAGWVLLVEQRQDPGARQRHLACPRTVASSSPFLERQRQNGPSAEELEELPILAAAPLLSDLPPSGLVWLMEQGSIRDWPPGSILMTEGEPSDCLSVVISGEAHLRGRDGRQVVLGRGETIGEMGVLTGQPCSRTVEAGPAGLRSFDLPAAVMEELLRRSRVFSKGLLRLLAGRLNAS